MALFVLLAAGAVALVFLLLEKLPESLEISLELSLCWIFLCCGKVSLFVTVLLSLPLELLVEILFSVPLISEARFDEVLCPVFDLLAVALLLESFLSSALVV